jgi:hypothetical protein
MSFQFDTRAPVRPVIAASDLAKGLACMSPRPLRLYIAASATSLTLLAVILAGTSPSPSALLLAVVGLVLPIIVPLWTGVPAIATTAAPERRS